MRTTFLVLVAAAFGLLAGCATQHRVASTTQSRNSGTNAPNFCYDDRQIARIQRGDTGEAQLLAWFGLPESREVKPDGHARLSWGFSRRTDGGQGPAGALSVSLTPDGKVEAYSARSLLPPGSRTIEIEEKSAADLREYREQWRREGWIVLSVSAPLRQADGTVRRKVELAGSESGSAAGWGYDDHRIANIRRGETTDSQLLDWFGPPCSRNLQPDGRAQLAWTFACRTDGGPGHSGELKASLAPNGTVDAYSARPGPQ